MKVLCDREKLREGLSLANNVIPSKNAKPILTNVCLVATGDALELVGTDLDVSLRYSISDGVKVIEPGTVVVPARVFHDFVRDFAGESVEIDTSESNCQLRCGDDSAELVTSDAEEYPVVPRFDSAEAYSLQAGTFTALVNKTAFAAAREQGRYAMHGVLAEVGDGILKMVATDGRRLALAHAPMNTDVRRANPGKPAIVPTKGMQLFCRVMSDPLDQVKLSFSDSQIGLKTHNAEVFARLLDGEFPRYTAVIPAESRNYCEADASLLERKIRLVANVTGEEARAVRFSIRGGHLELFGQSAGRGEARAHMEIDYKGQDAEIAFNPDYVVDGLKNCETGRVKLEFNEKTAPGKFLLGENYVYIVMPITIDS
ncbi:MAG: DNA polymerase III subunit beta [Planctomycetes bacterium]|nr:DNA polymerase III subunit beta [Planctomycetota bacterium]